MRTWVEELTVEECITHLSDASVGRLAVVVDGQPEIFPVNHAYEPETGGVVFPTNARTKFNAALQWPFATFEVDGSEEDGAGWSVVLVGEAEEVTDDAQIRAAMARRHADWAVSEQTRWLRIRPEKMTGRRITQVP